MLIKETVERECCYYPKDLKIYDGLRSMAMGKRKLLFCVHCGQVWYWSKEKEASSESEDTLERFII